MDDEGVMSIADIAKELGITRQEAQLHYASAMRKLLPHRHKEKTKAMIAAVYGESCVKPLMRNGSWRVKKVKKV